MSNLLIIASEQSSDQYAVHIVERLKALNWTGKITALAGDALRSVADHFVAETVRQNTVGITELMSNQKEMKQIMQDLDSAIPELGIDIACIIDSPHYNFEFAKIIASYDIPIITFITPNFWIWNDRRQAKKLMDYSYMIFTIYPKEQRLYENDHQRAHYIGHPVMANDVAAVKWDAQKNAVILPGSRDHEISYLLPVMCRAALRTRSIEAWTICIPKSKLDLVKRLMSAKFSEDEISSFQIWTDDWAPILVTSKFALCAAGSSSIELMHRRIPMMLLGRLSWLSYIIATYILRLKVPFIALPNILLGYRAVPEYKQFLPVKKISDEIDALLSQKEKRQPMWEAYDILCKKLRPKSMIYNTIAMGIMTVYKKEVAKKKTVKTEAAQHRPSKTEPSKISS